MVHTGDGMGISRNIKLIEWLKSELLTGVATLYQILFKESKNSQEAMADAIANIILVCYLLARRLGINFASVDLKVHDKIKLGIMDEHEIEKWYGDLSELSAYFNRNRR